MEKQLVELKKAQEQYALEGKYDVTEKLLQYILIRIEANKDEIEKLKKIRKERYSHERIINCEEEKSLLKINEGILHKIKMWLKNIFI